MVLMIFLILNASVNAYGSTLEYYHGGGGDESKYTRVLCKYYINHIMSILFTDSKLSKFVGSFF